MKSLLTLLYGSVMVISITAATLSGFLTSRTLTTFLSQARASSSSTSIFVTGFPFYHHHHRHQNHYNLFTVMEQQLSTSPVHGKKRKIQSLQSSAASTTETTENNNAPDAPVVPLYLAEGLLAVDKPLNWTSQDVVSYVRKIIERDARDRGANVAKIGRKNKSRQIKVGHGGTLDPLATGVLVLGVGKGTKDLTKYLHGSKAYRATGRFGTETTTLDLDPTANVTKTKPYDHVTFEKIDGVLPKFTGKIQQVPPVFSAKKQGGKKAYEMARKDGADSVKMEPREVEIHRLELLRADEQSQEEEDVSDSKMAKPDPISSDLPDFTIEMECAGGTFVRSLIRDVAYELDTVATTARLQRTKQGPFELSDCLSKDDWNADNINEQIRKWNDKLAENVVEEQ